MRKILLILLILFVSVKAYAVLTINNVPKVKTGGASPSLQDSVLYENGGNVGIGTSTPTSKLQVSGTATATAFSGPLTGNVTGNADTATTASNLGADGVDALTEVAQGIKTAANDTSPLVVGTAGNNGEIAKWNTDGTLTDSNLIVGTLTDARYCKYTAAGTLIDCNSTCADITGGAGLCDGSDDGGGSSAYSSITAPTANHSINFAGYTNIWTSTMDGNVVFKIDNSDADLAADTTLLQLEFTDDADANGIFLQARDNNGDLRYQIGVDGKVDEHHFTPQSAKITGAFVVRTPTSGDASTQGAQPDAGDGNYRLLFDATTDEAAVWQFKLPEDWNTHKSIDIDYTANSATSGTVEYEVDIMCSSDGDAADVGTASFPGVAVGSATVPGTAGYPDIISITPTDDSCVAGDMMWVFLSTDANDGTNDTATGDREVIGVTYKYYRK